uniref:Major facilitator superfamily (MFS) profile domain-containing protein n=1 Tax=Oryza punctata TaxID=4537 RepID=A0A0E0M503_ORYPU
MEATDEERPLLPLQSQDVGSEYTRDGSVDINKQPALKHSTGNWRACFFILGVEFCENMAYFVISRNLVTFLTTVLHESKVDAARNVSAWVGACFLTPVVGAFLADTYWGRYWTIVVFLPVYITGMLIVTVSASLPMKTSSEHCSSFSSVSRALSCCPWEWCNETMHFILWADRFDSTDLEELPKKASFFNWSFFMITTSSLLSSTVLVWLQDNVGWGVSCTIPTVLMIISFAVFVVDSRVYRFRKLGFSPLKSLCQMSSTIIEQGMVMDNHVGSFAIPPASFTIIAVLSALVLVPMYEIISVPLVKHFTGQDKGF